MARCLSLSLILIAFAGCTDVRSLPNVYVINRDDIKTLMSRYDDPGDEIAVWNSADGNRLIVEYQLRDYVTGNYMIFKRGQPEPTIYRDVADRRPHPVLWYPNGQHHRDWHGEPSICRSDQTNSVAVVSYYEREPRMTELIDLQDSDRVIATFESFGCPSVYVRGGLIFLVTYDYGQKVIALDRSTGQVLNRWVLPRSAEYDADRMDLTGEHMILIARPRPSRRRWFCSTPRPVNDGTS